MIYYGPEKILPYNNTELKSVQIGRMFDSIAGTYDALNHTLSLGIDKLWRRKALSFLRPFSPAHILDVGSGTGDLAIAMCKTLHPQCVIGADISEGMIAVGRKKAAAAGYSEQILFERQNCLSLTYADHSFDAVTSAFGVRNFERVGDGIAEMFRVLKPGGHIVILELSVPEKFPVKQLYNLYSNFVIPFVGRLFSKEKTAYQYLPASVEAFPQAGEMIELLCWHGFTKVKARKFTFGICSLYTGEKPCE
jgi:demethylmenaquinone methyltransferase/2-methoxy-6-polyprenyl-1,4-benzoquinol methylase